MRISTALSLGLIVATMGCVAEGAIEGDAVDDDGHGAIDSGPGSHGGSDAGVHEDIGTHDSGGHPSDDTNPPPEDTSTPPPTDTGTEPDTAPQPDTTPPPVDTTPPPDTGDPLEVARQACVDEINRYRSTLGLAPYARDPSDEICADGQAKKDSISGVAHSAFGTCSEFAQNECPGWPGPPQTLIIGCLKMMWAEGPGTPFSAHGHYINMSSTSYTKVSCGFYQTSSGSWWAVQDFR
jgi:hypothetical protein